MERDEKIAAEATALWIALFKEPPIVHAEGSAMLDALISTLPTPPGKIPDDAGAQD